MTRFSSGLFRVVLLIWLAVVPFARTADTNTPPQFKEIYDLLRAQLKGMSDADLDQAAAKGLLAQLQSQVTLVTNAPGTNAPTEGPALSSVALFDDAYAYLRVARVGSGLADQLALAYQQMTATNRLKGLVLDLRFAGGQDYAAAAAVADGFFAAEKPLLDWGEGMFRSKAKTNALTLRVALLVNRQTTGAAEALAGILRQADIGLLIGANTAGQASIAKEFPLKNGQRLRIATTPIKLGNGEPISSQGLKADIRVAVSAEDERAYFEDAYKVLQKVAGTASGGMSMTNAAHLTVTNRATRRRINEADLVRLSKIGQTPDDEFATTPAHDSEPVKPIVHDPALARAIDLLKGLAVVQAGRPI
jgi:hypothetical protein